MELKIADQAVHKNRFVNFCLNEKYVLWIVLFNAFILFLHAFDALSPIHIYLDVIDHLITIFYIFEIIIKVQACGWKAYIKDPWHKFDVVIILISASSLILFFMPSHANLEFILVLRLFRFFKFFRLIEFIPNIQKLTEKTLKAIRASVAVILMFFVYIFITAIFTDYIFKDVAPEYFSNPLQSFYTVFKIFTLEGWYEVPDQIAANTSPMFGFLTKMYFIFMALSGGILTLALVNAMFIDEMNREEREQTHDRLEQIGKLDEKISRLEEKLDQLLAKSGKDNN